MTKDSILSEDGRNKTSVKDGAIIKQRPDLGQEIDIDFEHYLRGLDIDPKVHVQRDQFYKKN